HGVEGWLAPLRGGVASSCCVAAGRVLLLASSHHVHLAPPGRCRLCRGPRLRFQPPDGGGSKFSCCIADELVLVLPRRHRLKLASPGRYSLCRSTRPGCEQRSAPAGSMGEFSCCTADELVLVPPGIALARVGVARVRYTRSPFDLQLPQLDIQIPYLVVFKGGVE